MASDEIKFPEQLVKLWRERADAALEEKRKHLDNPNLAGYRRCLETRSIALRDCARELEDWLHA